MFRVRDITGQKFNRLTAIRRVGYNQSHESMWECKCDCGNGVTVRLKSLVKGRTKSCGCYQREEVSDRMKTHGLSDCRLHEIWTHMRRRCREPNHHAYDQYGARGIKVCEEWNINFQSFYDWAMTNGYSDDLTLDRKDNDGNYEPGNCRWATMIEQQNNKSTNVALTINGIPKTIAEWSRETGIGYSTIRERRRRGKKSGVDLIKPVKHKTAV